VLHLGLGSFHRAHQAVYLQRLIDAGDTRWSLAAANIRPDVTGVLAALQAQGGRYTLETVSPAGEYRYEQIEAIREVLPWECSLAAVIARGAAPSTRIVSFTVTEAGYYLDTQGKLDLSFSDLAADLERARRGEAGEDGSGSGEGVTIYGAVCAILRARKARQAGPVTLLNCDNLRHNGDRFRDGLREFIELAGDSDLLSWVGANTLCPNAMVDRITPRPPPELRARVKAATGRDDAAAVTGESFIQWVIEDSFAAGRPDWGRVGVELVESVQPYEEAKIRILNATHSCIAWAGTLLGLEFIHEGTHHAAIRKMAWDYVTDDVIPCLSPGPESDRPGGLPGCGHRPLRQSLDPRHQPARGGGWIFEDPGLHRAHGARTACDGAADSRRCDAARAVPRLPAALASRGTALCLPGPGHGRGRGTHDLRRCRSGTRIVFGRRVVGICRGRCAAHRRRARCQRACGGFHEFGG
jgi:D-arabinitol 4-dehydrogenase